uniref:Syntenin-1 n=1 Tax=Aceria tosichella TaxID=561515 RepID=A0A6G1SIF2_9ACAR
MSNLYPSLEDFKYDLLMNSKHPASNIGTHLRGVANGIPHSGAIIQNGHQKYSATSEVGSLYPSFSNGHHIGAHLDHDLYSIGAQSSSVSVPGKSAFIAPLSGYSQAHRYQPSNTIRPVVICKDSIGKVGLRLASVQGGVFVVLVYANSPAAMAGLKFGDQILEINDVPVAGYSMNKVHELIKKASPDELRFAIRDRPFERTVTLHKDQNGLVGFIFNKQGRIVSIVKDSSAARNGLLIDHNILEINAQNIVGLDESEIRTILDNCGDVVILTVMPSKIFETMIKETDPKLIRKNMDHTAPDI